MRGAGEGETQVDVLPRAARKTSDAPAPPSRKDALISIGDMAKLFNTSVRTLRYYGERGLLSPEFVDERTGYRYYSVAQFERMNTIKYLRALDVPLEKIADFFADRDVSSMLSIFTEQLAEVRAKQVMLSQVERKIKSRIAQIESAQTSRVGTPVLRTIKARTAVVLERSFGPDADLEPLLRSLGREFHLEEAIFLGKVGVSVARENLAAGSFGRLSSVFVALEAGEGVPAGCAASALRTLPDGEWACLSFHGTHRAAASHYAELCRWVRGEGLEIAGDSVEITIIDAGMTSDEAQYLTEIQIPCARLCQGSGGR